MHREQERHADAKLRPRLRQQVFPTPAASPRSTGRGAARSGRRPTMSPLTVGPTARRPRRRSRRARPTARSEPATACAPPDSCPRPAGRAKAARRPAMQDEVDPLLRGKTDLARHDQGRRIDQRHEARIDAGEVISQQLRRHDQRPPPRRACAHWSIAARRSKAWASSSPMPLAFISMPLARSMVLRSSGPPWSRRARAQPRHHVEIERSPPAGPGAAVRASTRRRHRRCPGLDRGAHDVVPDRSTNIATGRSVGAEARVSSSSTSRLDFPGRSTHHVGGERRELRASPASSPITVTRSRRHRAARRTIISCRQ